MSPASQKSVSSRGRRVALLALKVLISGCATLLLVEIGLRVVGLWPVTATVERRDLTELHEDPDIAEAQRKGWIPWPARVQSATKIAEHPRGYVEIRRNRCSLREDAEIPFEKPPATRRILCIGDSHTDGVCWNSESYPNLLEERWRGAAATAENGTEVINAGFGPSSPYQQLWAFEKVHRRFHPDVIVVGFYAGNDLIDLLRPDNPVRLERKEGVLTHVESGVATTPPTTNRSVLETVKRPLRDYSSVYHALTRIPWLRRAVVRKVGVGDEYHNRIEYAALAHPGPIWQGLNQAYYFHHHPDEWQEAVKRERQVLRRLGELAAEQGAQLRMIVIPTLRLIHPESDSEALDDAARILELTPHDLATDERACDVAVQLARELDIRCLDLRAPFRRYRREHPDRELYYRFDHHLNVTGNQVIADQLASYLGAPDDASPRAEAGVKVAPASP